MEHLTRLLSQYKALALALAFVALVGLYALAFSPPRDFPSGTSVVIEEGASASEIAEALAEARVIKHPDALRLIFRLTGGGERVQAGTYMFSAPQSACTVARRLTTGAYDITLVRITFPEGVTVRDIAEKVSAALPDVTAADVLAAAEGQEGYLFPDTYLFLPTDDAQTVISLMRENFDTKIAPLGDAVRASGRSLSDIIILASLVEKEARSTEVRKTIAGILLNRLNKGMPLQVDAVFGYIFSRDTYSPSFEDLKVDSPYNTYLYKGLPPGPISNPGLDSIEAVLSPTKTDYLYYLTDREGVMHYATTYAAHQANQRTYLK